jgi:hypothetical protein
MNMPNPFNGDMRKKGYDQMLERMGLQRKGASDMRLSSIGLFAMGLVVGAGIGLLFAPRRGEATRSQALEKLPGTHASTRGQEQIYRSSH